ncbi:MAG: hypothetical protein ACJ77K_00845 [Bacteroidia bacterium]
MKKILLLILLPLAFPSGVVAQPVPSTDEKFPFLGTFGKNSLKEWGDDDFVQTFFFVVPMSEKNPVYIRIFDPETGGSFDELHGASFNTKTRFSVYGGKGAHSDPDCKKSDPTGNFKSGIQLVTKVFGNDTAFDNKWTTLGPFNPTEGEIQPDFGGYVFKIVVEGLEGDDGNLYRLFLSSKSNENKEIEGGNAFAYEYSLRLSDTKSSVAHLYPFIASNVTAVNINIFDYDDDGVIRVVTVAKKGTGEKSSSNNEWKKSTQPIVPEEHNTSMDIQFIKLKDSNNNNIVVYIQNQYGENMPFFASPIGGVPKYKYKIKVKTGTN